MRTRLGIQAIQHSAVSSTLALRLYAPAGMTSHLDSLTRRQLLERTGRLAVAAGVVPLAGRLAELAWSAPPGIYGQLARTLRGDVVVPGGPAYTQARVLYNTRFDGVH